jgi:hypothetical protein
VSKFADVPLSDDLTCCRKCRKRFSKGDRVSQIMVVAGVDKQARPGAHLFFMDGCEFGHVNCRDRLITKVSSLIKEVPRQLLKPNKHIEPLRPRFNEYTCAACRQQLKRGDRIVVATIVEGIAIDPETKAPAPQCTAEFEVVHADCTDPKLEKGPGPLVVSG